MRDVSQLIAVLALGATGLLAAAVEEKPAASAAPAAKPAASAAFYGWRGDGSGRFPDATPCTVWGGDKDANILWKADTGKSYAGPAVAGDIVVVTGEPDRLTCVSRKDGKVLWDCDNSAESLPPELKKDFKPDSLTPGGGFATATPLTDGKQIFVIYGTGITACYDLDGKRRWVRVLQADSAPAEAGHCASPVLADGKLIVTFGGLVALNPATGATLWENKDATETCSTPAVTKIGDQTVLVTGSGECVSATDGKLLASGLGDASLSYPSPIVQGGVAYFAGKTVSAAALPARPGEKFNAKPLWSVDLEADVFASGVWHDGIVYVADNAATFYALDAKDGKVIYKQTLELPANSNAGIYGSLALAGGNLYVGNSLGHFVVVAPGREFKLVQSNSIEGGEGCSPAFAGKQMFLRVNDTLTCIATK